MCGYQFARAMNGTQPLLRLIFIPSPTAVPASSSNTCRTSVAARSTAARTVAAAAARGLELPMFCNSPDFTQPDPADRKKEVYDEDLLAIVNDELPRPAG